MSPLPAGVRAVLLDVEGTTTPLAFVSGVLFPYVRARVAAYVAEHAAAGAYPSLLARLRREHEAERARGETPPLWPDDASRLDAATAFVTWLMDRDSKSTPLKELQGLIWEDGYRRGDLVGQVFADVPAALRRWRDDGVSANVFSSGSTLAQQLLFRHSTAGDLTPLLDSYFDTRVGAKRQADSYQHIAERLTLAAGEILFLSDMVPELEAARDAGMQVRLVTRPGNAPVAAQHLFAAIHDFDAL